MSGPFEEGAIDAELLGRLLDRHGASLALYASQWTAAAEDCVQEAFVELARQRALPKHVVGWLYRVVKNRALNAARGERRRRERETQWMALRLVTSGPPMMLDRNDSTAMVDALGLLEAGQREIIMMRVWGGLTFEEIAAAFSIAVSTAHRQYFQALEKLRQVLEPTCSADKNQKSLR